MESILSTNYYVHFQPNAYQAIEKYLEDNFHSKVYILVDTNTKKYCLPILLKELKNSDTFEIIEISAGEIYKHLDTCLEIWNTLSELGADRKSIMINLGGGVVTDMGGFVASTFKRGIKFINIPTTLLSMVDASVGGKTGIDLGVLKNQIGLFSNPEMVIIDNAYLKTVSDKEIRSGLAEVIKYGFTFDKSIWDKIKLMDTIDFETIDTLIYRSVQIKNDVVLVDPKEENLRKSLNFGHTIGHAIESYFLENEDKIALTHGEAIAVGMIIELYFSSKLFGFPMEYTSELKNFVNRFYGKYDLNESDFDPIINLMQFDKKNINGKVNFVLLDKMEHCKMDVQVDKDLLNEGLKYYLQ
jgi:3-dehydroquinate synthase